MAHISENLYAWSNTGSSNQPDSGDTPTVQGDLQAIQAGVRGWLAHKGADIASATTTDIGAVEGLMHDITGTTTITGLGTVSAGIWKVLQFDGALTLTHNATSLILPGGVNITTAAGDIGVFISLGSGNWQCVSYTKASGASLNAAPPGAITDFAGSSVPEGWLECDGSAVSRTTYSRLFTAISTTWGVGDGATTFNLPNFKGKVRIGRGTGSLVDDGEDADVDTTNDTLTIPSNADKWTTGMAVVFNLTSGTITGLSDDTTYYVIRASATTIKLASTLANAQNGTAIDLTAKSSPVWDITYNLSARTLGEYGGEEEHAESSTEHLSHTHIQAAHAHVQRVFAAAAGFGSTTNAGASSGTEDSNVGSTANATATNNSTGGNAAMNNMSPFGVVMTIIKY